VAKPTLQRPYGGAQIGQIPIVIKTKVCHIDSSERCSLHIESPMTLKFIGQPRRSSRFTGVLTALPLIHIRISFRLGKKLFNF
jgi:hypothetical protein